jgi:hypothetical protein
VATSGVLYVTEDVYITTISSAGMCTIDEIFYVSSEVLL